MKKSIKKILKNKLFIATVFIIVLGMIVANFTSLIGYALIGAIVLIIGIVGFSYLEVLKENKKG